MKLAAFIENMTSGLKTFLKRPKRQLGINQYEVLRGLPGVRTLHEIWLTFDSYLNREIMHPSPERYRHEKIKDCPLN